MIFERAGSPEEGVTVALKPRRRGLSADKEVRVARRTLYWYGLRQAGLSLRDIEADSGFHHSTIGEYTSEAKVQWARQVLIHHGK